MGEEPRKAVRGFAHRDELGEFPGIPSLLIESVNRWGDYFAVPVLVIPVTSEGQPSDELIERMARADLHSPLCVTCEDVDSYDRSPEQCVQCAAIRARAAFSALEADTPSPEHGT